MCIMINHWMNMKNVSVQETPIELKSSCNLANILAKVFFLTGKLLLAFELTFVAGKMASPFHDVYFRSVSPTEPSGAVPINERYLHPCQSKL